MVIIDVNMTVDMNNKKVSAVKTLREITGMSLMDAKNYVEQHNMCPQRVRMNESQFGRLVLASHESRTDGWPDPEKPNFSFDTPKRVDTPVVTRDFTL